MTVLPALDAEAMPAAIVERAGELLDQAAAAILANAAVGALALGGDALLQHGADHPAVLRRPKIRAGVEQTFARCFEADRSAFFFGQRLPQQPIAYAGGGRATVQFFVDRIALGFGRLQQALHLGGDLGLQMIFQDGALVRGEQFAALGDLFGEARGKAIRRFGPVLVDDVDDEPPIARFGLRLLAERAEGALQFCEVLGDLLAARVPTLRRRP